MPDDMLQSIRNLFEEFGDLSLQDFRDAFHDIVKTKNPSVDRYLVEEMKNFRGNRTMRAEIAAALSEREDEAYLDDFALVIEKETDVGLCKECIQGLVKIGTQEAIQKLEFLSKNKPNATISSLLRQEMDKLRHEEKEPIAYYLDHLGDGNKNARGCLHASRVLIKMGDPKVVDEILEKFNDYDDLARAEGAKVLSQLAQGIHQGTILDILDHYSDQYAAMERFIDAAEGFDQSPKEDRIDLLKAHAASLVDEDQEPFYQQFLGALEALDKNGAEQVLMSILDLGKHIGLDYCLKSLVMIMDNKIAHANTFHEEVLRSSRVRQSRMRHLVGQLGYGIGKIAGQAELDEEERDRTVAWLTRLVGSSDGDVVKLALYGAAFMARPEDHKLLEATIKAHQVDGMTRLIGSLERKKDLDFTDFFLNVAMNHEILDIQEMAMRALGRTEEVFAKLREMLSDSSPDIRRMGIRIMGEIKALEFLDDMLALLTGQSDIIRVEAINTLGKLGAPSVLPQINDVMHDAKSPVLIEAGLQAVASIGGSEGIDLLRDFAEKTRNRKIAVTAIKLLAGSYKSWSKPFPIEFNDMLIKHLKSWFEERDATVRREAYQIAGGVITLDLKFYDTLKVLFKEASTRLRGQSNWDKEEMSEVEGQVRTLNRNYFFLKDLLEFQDALKSKAKGFDSESSTQRIQAFDKTIEFLAKNDRFVLSPQNEEFLESMVLKGLELCESNWREQGLAFQVAAYVTSEKLTNQLSGRVRDVPLQAKAHLLEALSSQGLSLQEIHDLTSIKKILVLEGSGFYRKRLVKFLNGKGYETQDTDDLDEAAEMVKTNIPDLILTEITFKQECDGAAFTERIAKEFGARIILIFSTNTREASVMERIMRLKPKKIFFKPYPLEDLDESIKA